MSSSQGIEALTHLALRVPAVGIASLVVGEQLQRWRLPVITGHLLDTTTRGPQAHQPSGDVPLAGERPPHPPSEEWSPQHALS